MMTFEGYGARAPVELTQLPGRLRPVYVDASGRATRGEWTSTWRDAISTTIPLGILLLGMEDDDHLLWMFAALGRKRPFIWMHRLIIGQWIAGIDDAILAMEIQMNYDLVNQYLKVCSSMADLEGETMVLSDEELARLRWTLEA